MGDFHQRCSGLCDDHQFLLCRWRQFRRHSEHWHRYPSCTIALQRHQLKSWHIRPHRRPFDSPILLRHHHHRFFLTPDLGFCQRPRFPFQRMAQPRRPSLGCSRQLPASLSCRLSHPRRHQLWLRNCPRCHHVSFKLSPVVQLHHVYRLRSSEALAWTASFAPSLRSWQMGCSSQ